MDAHRFQNALRIMWNLDRYDLINADVFAAHDQAGWEFFHDTPHVSAARMDEERFARLFALIESRQPKREEHTQTSWIVYEIPKEGVYIVGGGGVRPATTITQVMAESYTTGGINSHVALEARVKALREALTKMITHFAPPVDESEWPDAHERHALRIARAALKESSDA